MFSDIEGSTAMADRLGDAQFMEVLREHNAIIREQVKAHGGFEVKSEGDGFMVAFQSAGKALACASAIQKALAERNDEVRNTSFADYSEAECQDCCHLFGVARLWQIYPPMTLGEHLWDERNAEPLVCHVGDRAFDG